MQTLSCDQIEERLTIINELTATLYSSTDIDQILDRTLGQIMDYLQIEVGEVFLTQEDSKILKRVLHRGSLVEKFWDRMQFQPGEGVVGKVAQSGQPLLLDLENEMPHGLDSYVLEKKIHQITLVPVSSRRGALGVLCVASTAEFPLNDSEVQFLMAISTWVGMLIENVRLSLQQRRLAVLEERERIGMDLHDGIIQSIYGVGLTLEHARLLMDEDHGQARERIQQAIHDLDRTIRDIRAYILDLRPRQLYDETLAQGVQRLVNEFRVNTLVTVNLQLPPDGLETLPISQAVALFHICQESLANVAKHARAREVNVALWTAASRALLEVSDDGRGFEPEKIKLTLGHGLSNMQTRAHNVGGDVEFSSDKGVGTTILAWVPYTP
jgi:two-component system, NarL family, sensor histidine kinase DevS